MNGTTTIKVAAKIKPCNNKDKNIIETNRDKL